MKFTADSLMYFSFLERTVKGILHLARNTFLMC